MRGKTPSLAIYLSGLESGELSYRCVASTDDKELLAAVMVAISELAKRDGFAPSTSARAIANILEAHPDLFAKRCECE